MLILGLAPTRHGLYYEHAHKGSAMRITAAEKAATRQRILSAAKALFRSKGFDVATTRDIAKEVGIATGTMFNYFRTKEAIVVELAAQALEKADKESKNGSSNGSLQELLFGSIAAQLRCLRPLRTYLRPFLETALSPLPPNDEPAASLRLGLHQHFTELLEQNDVADPTPLQMSILWSLYVGVLGFWSNDKSPKQEDTLALLDQSVRMYVDWLAH